MQPEEETAQEISPNPTSNARQKHHGRGPAVEMARAATLLKNPNFNYNLST